MNVARLRDFDCERNHYPHVLRSRASTLVVFLYLKRYSWSSQCHGVTSVFRGHKSYMSNIRSNLIEDNIDEQSSDVGMSMQSQSVYVTPTNHIDPENGRP